MNIRQASQGDTKALVQLTFASAPRLLAATFDIDQQFSAKHFLQSCLSNADGQYGYANHWVAEMDNQVVGCVSAWDIDLPDTFHQATLSQLTSFYGLAHSLSVVFTSQVLQDCIPKPQKHELCIGHFAVLNQYQRQGVGQALLEFMHKRALGAGKLVLGLDVESTNTGAIGFYLNQGFVQKSESGISQRMQTLGISSYLHLDKYLI